MSRSRSPSAALGLALAGLGALAALVVVVARRRRPRELVGVEHPAGEMRLLLEPDGRFALRLLVWDQVAGAVVGSRELAGRWRRTSEGLELRAPGRTVVYARAAEPAGAFVWRRSSLPTFADGIALVRAGR